MSNRDMVAVRRLLDYCNQINATLLEFGNDKERFMESHTCRNAICLCLLQIGELVTILSEEFKTTHSTVSWREMKYLRNTVAHRYNTVDYEIIWGICITDIPELMEFCREVIDDTHRRTT